METSMMLAFMIFLFSLGDFLQASDSFVHSVRLLQGLCARLL